MINADDETGHIGMKRIARHLMRQGQRLGCMAALWLGALALPAAAQSDLFVPAATVNGTVITRYELQQRRDFLTALNQTGDVEKMALVGLISDRLQMDVAKQHGITVSDDEVRAGMDEFAARGNVSTEDFLKGIAESRVDPQTFRDFVKAGLLWRGVIRGKYAGQVKITDAEVDRAIAQGAASGGGLRLLLSVLVLTDDGKTDVASIAQRIRDRVKSPADFAQEAMLFSKAPTAPNGGALDWVDEKSLPPEVAAAVTRLKPGEMSQPVRQKGTLTLYFLRDVSEAGGKVRGPSMVDYALFVPPIGTNAARLQATLTTCDGLYVAARGLPVDNLQRQTVLETTLPPTLRGPMAAMNAGESTVLTGPGGVPEVLMLCARTPRSAVPPSRDDVRSQLINQRITLLAQTYMEELRTQAIITMQ